MCVTHTNKKATQWVAFLLPRREYLATAYSTSTYSIGALVGRTRLPWWSKDAP